jgi:hypothetical protein
VLLTGYKSSSNQRQKMILKKKKSKNMTFYEWVKQLANCMTPLANIMTGLPD